MRDLLLHMAESDRRLGSQLALSGELFAGYHPAMRVLHENNARELELLIDDDGWPSIHDAGDDGVMAAFHIAMQAISRPAFLRRCLTLMKAAAQRGEIPAWHPATLEDRIRVLEGRPQIYGSQMDWDDDGHLSPLPLADEDGVDARRAAVGLPPLADSIAHIQALAAEDNQYPLAEWIHRQHAMADFAHTMGWR